MSPRTRVRLLVGLAALVAAAVAVGATLIGRGGDGEGQQAARRDPPPLELSIIVRNDPEARALRAAERAYDRGRKAAAREQFAELTTRYPGSIEAAVGAAIAAWPRQTVEKLRRLADRYPDSALVRLHLGLALYSTGDDEGAVAQWREAKRRGPDTPAALRAEDLLHPDMAPGRPFFYFDRPASAGLAGLSPQQQLDELEQRAESGGADDLIQYGIALQRVGRPVSARDAFDAALEQDAKSLSAQVAADVVRFDKDNPSAAFSRLGPLSRSHPRSALVRFHLGVLLLWIRDVEDARTQLQRAADADPRGFYGKEARTLLSRLEAIGT